ncbi:response regulator transcription factor [Paenibacillus sp. 1P07SE]|uniref:response regulator transcription factor n=1 Tax=Paenibacillus sp. 1P07SE TaxID=3132209 RepID=UPI0039A4B467
MYKVILVEDEVTIRNGLKQLIEDTIGGYRVIGEANHGKEALELLHVMQPDLLISDIRMAEMDGLEMIKRIRESHRQLHLIILSGYAEFEYAKHALRYGVADYLLKPIDRVELKQVLDKFRHAREPDASALIGEAQEEGRQDRQLIRRVKTMIEERLDQEISLQLLADQVHLNHQYLSVLFKSETGQNFSAYVTSRRISKAKELLTGTNLKIYEVAQLSGYMSAKHFMSVFKNAEGITPTEYRESSQH